jgi:hypothetical protein
LTWTPTANRTDAMFMVASYGAVASVSRVDLISVSGGGVVTIDAGTSLRQALLIEASACVDQVTFFGMDLTVDHSLGLRCWAVTTPPTTPTDGVTPVIVDTSGAIKPTDLSYDIDVSGIVRGVLVNGTGATALVFDLTGKIGRFAVLDDSTVTTGAQAIARGQAYVNDYKVGLRGSLSLEDVAGGPRSAIDVLRLLNLIDSSTGVSGTFTINTLGFTFYGTKRDVRVAFGGLAPSGAAAMRRLTRDTLS